MTDNLQTQFDQLPAGKTLRLEPHKEFQGPVIIRRPAIVDGQGATIWAAVGPVVSIQADGVVLRDVNLEVTSRETNLAGEKVCALVVGQRQAVTLENVSVRGDVLGLAAEEGHWACPRAVNLGTVQANLPHEFRLQLIVPAAATIESEIDGLHVKPRDVRGDPVEVLLHLEPLSAGTRLRGQLKLRTAAGLVRHVAVSGIVSGTQGIKGTGQMIWKPDGSLPRIPVEEVLASQPVFVEPAAPPRSVPASSAPAAGAALVVAQFGDAQFQTIGDALRGASSGARILVRPGLYKESLVLDRKVEIVGDGPVSEIVIEGQDASCVRSQAEIARLRGLTLRGAAGGKEKYAVQVLHGQLIVEDCAITCQSLACVGIHGPTATPTFRRCKIHGGASAGVLTYDSAEATFDDCEIFDNALAGVEVRQDANPTLNRCKVHGGKQVGIFVHAAGRGNFSECEVYGHPLANVEVRHTGKPQFRRCKFSSGLSVGLRIHENGQPTLEDCEITGNALAGVEVGQDGGVTLTRCQVREGKQAGLLIRNNGKAVLDGCEVSGNALAGVEVRQRGQPTLRQSKIHNNRLAGLLFADAATGLAMDCEVFSNGTAGVIIVGEASPTLRRCTVRDNRQAGVAWRGGAGTVEECTITANAQSGLIVTQSAEPTVRLCAIKDNRDLGVWACQRGGGTVEDSDLTGNRSGDVETESAATLQVRRSKLDPA